MNQQTITGSTDSNGLFTAKNPYIHPCGKVKMYCRYKEPCSCFKHDEFKNAHPPLFCYNENNDLVKGVEGLEVKGPVWQYKCDPECVYEWDGCLDNSPEGYIAIATTRQVYIAVQPTEKADLPISKGTLPEAQPLEGVKFAHPFRVGRKQNRAVLDANGVEVVVFKDGLQDMAMNYCNMLNAQFATDAGGGNKQLLTDCQEMLMNLIALNHVPDEVCPDMNDMISRIDDALTAPSTHSSSEMVEGWVSV